MSEIIHVTPYEAVDHLINLGVLNQSHKKLLKAAKKGDDAAWEKIVEAAHDIEERAWDADEYVVNKNDVTLKSPLRLYSEYPLIFTPPKLGGMDVANLAQCVLNEDRNPNWKQIVDVIEGKYHIGGILTRFIASNFELMMILDPDWQEKANMVVDVMVKSCINCITDPISAIDNPVVARSIISLLAYSAESFNIGTIVGSSAFPEHNQARQKIREILESNIDAGKPVYEEAHDTIKGMIEPKIAHAIAQHTSMLLSGVFMPVEGDAAKWAEITVQTYKEVYNKLQSSKIPELSRDLALLVNFDEHVDLPSAFRRANWYAERIVEIKRYVESLGATSDKSSHIAWKAFMASPDLEGAQAVAKKLVTSSDPDNGDGDNDGGSTGTGTEGNARNEAPSWMTPTLAPQMPVQGGIHFLNATITSAFNKTARLTVGI